MYTPQKEQHQLPADLAASLRNIEKHINRHINKKYTLFYLGQEEEQLLASSGRISDRKGSRKIPMNIPTGNISTSG